MKTSSRQRPPPHRAAHGLARPAAYHDAYLDGLFTYCLSVLCEHDAATVALAEALAVAERQHEQDRRPADPALLRPWLYALARWACLRRLDARRRGEDGPLAPRVAGEDAQRRREVAALAWPEAAGTSAEQREALELAVRHQLPAPEVARVLRVSVDVAHTLLTTGAREVERTRGALAALESAGCTAAVALAGAAGPPRLLSPGLRRELVRHVDECLPCQRAAHREMARATWSGATPAGGVRLTVLAAPRPAVHAARLAVHRARARHTPRLDRVGFPVPEQDRAARRRRLRGRAVTTTVVATVLAAPALALWAAWRGVPVTGEPVPQGPAATRDDADPAAGEGRYPPPGDPGAGAGGPGAPAPAGGAGGPAVTQPGADGAGGAAGDESGPSGADRGGAPVAGQLAVTAEATAAGTRLTLTASGDAPVSWTATSDAGWLELSRSAGTLHPGEQAVVLVSVDGEREPPGPWRAQIAIGPGHATVTLEGGAADAPQAPDGPGEPEPEEPGGGAEDGADPGDGSGSGEPPGGEPEPEEPPEESEPNGGRAAEGA